MIFTFGPVVSGYSTHFNFPSCAGRLHYSGGTGGLDIGRAWAYDVTQVLNFLNETQSLSWIPDCSRTEKNLFT